MFAICVMFFDTAKMEPLVEVSYQSCVFYRKLSFYKCICLLGLSIEAEKRDKGKLIFYRCLKVARKDTN